VGAILLVVPVAIMIAAIAWSVRYRRRYAAAMRSPLAVRRGGVAIGSAGAIVDAGQVPWRDLLDALAVKPEDDNEWNDGWMGIMLGLETHWSESTSNWEPSLMSGHRGGREVHIRLGADKKIEGPMDASIALSKHFRAVTTVAAPLPQFELAGRAGDLQAVGPVPPAVAQLLARLGPSPQVWRDVTVTAGPEGITATRPNQLDPLNTWLYDLWLCERIATVMTAP
jgi:hypothetical protein